MTLSGRLKIADDTFLYTFDTENTRFSFRAGQYVDVILVDPPESDSNGAKRDLSICSSPNESEIIQVATRAGMSAFKKNLSRLPIGSTVRIRGPSGSFVLHDNASRTAVCIAGGIGITPIRSIIAWATEERLPHSIYLFYANTTRGRVAFASDFEKWSKENTQFHYIPAITDEDVDSSWSYEKGDINGEMISRNAPHLVQPIYYVAGPPAFVQAQWNALREHGAPVEDIKTEEFSGYTE